MLLHCSINVAGLKPKKKHKENHIMERLRRGKKEKHLPIIMQIMYVTHTLIERKQEI